MRNLIRAGTTCMEVVALRCALRLYEDLVFLSHLLVGVRP